MPSITLNPSGKIVHIAAGANLLEAVKAEGVSVEAPCGGRGVCGKCLVRVESGTVVFDNNGILPKELVDDGFVLICRSKATDSPATLQILSQLEKEKGKFSEAAEDMLTLERGLLPESTEYDPIVKKVFLQVSEAVMGDGLSDLDRLERTALSELGLDSFALPLNVLRSLPAILRENDGWVTISYYTRDLEMQVVTLESVDSTSHNYGVAIDIGTTTIAIHLVDLINGEILGSKTDYNSQIECGLDVISRINYAQKPQRLEELRTKVLETINKSINELLNTEPSSTEKIIPTQILNASIAGNTTMMHLLLGIPPENIRLEPYTPGVYWIPEFRAADIGIDINPNSTIFFAPSVGSYLGGDISSGLLCTALATDSEELNLFIDIGTNGEIVFGNNEFLIGCACSAGPAFEGGGIEHGMRASHGAIERVVVDKETGVPEYFTIGNEAPIGICGSGMISLIAELFSKGWIDAAGKLNKTKACPAIEVNGKNSRYIIATVEQLGKEVQSAKEAQPGNGSPIYIDEADIANLIRAKAAIFSACRVMLRKISVEFDDLSKIYIAGGFGRYLDIEKSVEIGLLPNLPLEKFKFIGNSSVAGAYMTLLSKKHRDLEKELSKKITYLDLSTEHEYMDEYTAALFLPHTDARLFKK